ncbi:MAG: ribulokinase [Clostridia bacterium]|nr:ribulokinase [Clostridia bacterium]
MRKHHVIGVDFGSDSARAIILDAYTGIEISQAVAGYPRWQSGLYQNARESMFRQHPLDYVEALELSVREALAAAGQAVREDIASISIDTTGSTPCPVDANGTPLAMLSEFWDDPHAMFHLWKDHTAVDEAKLVSKAFRENADGIDYTRYQGEYSSEWFWAKILATINVSAKVRQNAYSWVEHSDWIPSMLSGETRPEAMYRCACAAGHKAYWHSAWGGLPSCECLSSLDPYLEKVSRTYGKDPLPATHRLGRIAPEWADRLGLDRDVIIGGSSFDAHAGAVGAGVNERTLVINLGTSAVDLFVAKSDSLADKNMAWAGGMAENSIIPGLTGIEAGQAAFGDALAWFKKLLLWPLEGQADEIKNQIEDSVYSRLQDAASRVSIDMAPVALDWFNARRYPYVNESVKSAITGLDMGTDAPSIYRSLVTAVVLGQKRIIESWAGEGISPDDIIAVGGIAHKSPLLMQALADALGKNVSVLATKQACARGAAMYAAVAAGLYENLEKAQVQMREKTIKIYRPDTALAGKYADAYDKYLKLSSFMDARV